MWYNYYFPSYLYHKVLVIGLVLSSDDLLTRVVDGLGDLDDDASTTVLMLMMS